MQIGIATPSLELWRIEQTFTNVPHIHDDRLQVTIPIRGTCHFTHEHREFQLKEGNALVQHPREKHHFRIGDDAGVIIIQLRPDRLTGDGGAPGELSPHQYMNPQDIHSRFREWTRLFAAGDGSDPLAVQEAETEVIAYLSRSLKGSFRPERDEPAVRRPPYADPHLSRVIDYIHASFRSPLTIDDMAALAMQSRYHFIRSFKAATGMSPYQYVLRVRVEEAKRKLRSTAMSVTDISLHVGFSSTSQLHRTFHNAVGLSPEKYRTQTRRVTPDGGA